MHGVHWNWIGEKAWEVREGVGVEQRVLLEGCQNKNRELSRDLDYQPEGLDFILKVRGVRMGRTWGKREEGASAL